MDFHISVLNKINDGFMSGEGHMNKVLGIIFLITCLASVVWAELNVVATVPNMGMVAREVGGEAVRVRVLAGPDRDAHFLEARPSMMAALRRADIVVSVGAELEIGWLPAAIRGANNRRIQPGQPGYFEGADFVDLIGVGRPADRALGDVHPSGNPHFYLDPERMASLAMALAKRFGELNPEKTDYFSANAESFGTRVAQKMPSWREAALGASGVLLYHEDADYLLHALNVPVLGYIEPLPGIPPTAAHLRQLVQSLRGQTGLIWSMNYHPANAGEFLSRELGWPFFQLSSQVPMEGTAKDYFSMIQAWVDVLQSTQE